jgi:hypothetical protein
LRLCRALSVLAALALLVLTNQNLLAQSDPRWRSEEIDRRFRRPRDDPSITVAFLI